MKEMKKRSRNGKAMKVAELFPREYGMAAYRAWLRREEAITALAQTRRYAMLDICHMREDSYRQMKAEGARWAAAKSSAAARPVPRADVCAAA